MKTNLILLSILIGVIYGTRISNNSVPTVSSVQLPTKKEIITVAEAKETNEPKIEDVVYTIAKTFSGEGSGIVVRAINCFYGESKLKPDALHKNRNGSYDAGVAQLNDVHGLTISERMDYQKNLAKAYQIYLESGKNFSKWYAKGCR